MIDYKKKDNGLLFLHLLFLYPVVVMALGTILDKLLSPDINTISLGESITIIFSFIGGIVGFIVVYLKTRRCFLLRKPFKSRITSLIDVKEIPRDCDYSRSRSIKFSEKAPFSGKIRLEITSRILNGVNRINISFVQKNFIKWIKVSSDKISVSDVKAVGLEDYFQRINTKREEDGGFTITLNPIYRLPKKESFYLDIFIDCLLKEENKLKTSISFKNYHDSTVIRRKLTFLKTNNTNESFRQKTLWIKDINSGPLTLADGRKIDPGVQFWAYIEELPECTGDTIKQVID